MTRNINYVGVPSSKIKQRVELSSSDLVPKLVEFSADTSIAGNATGLSYGAWTQVIAATLYDTTFISVNATGMDLSGIDTSALLDIAIGGSGSEQAIISSIPCGYTLDNIGLTSCFPVYIPKGSRLSVRLLATLNNDTVNVTIGLFQDIIGKAPTSLDTYGANIASARGTNMLTSDTYTEVTSSTTKPYKALIMMPAVGGSSSISTERSTYTLATGQSGSEVAVATMVVATNSLESLWIPVAGNGGIATGYFPRGTRIACKQSVGRNYRDVIVYGVPFA